MNKLSTWIYLAGGVQLLIVLANIFIPKKLQFSESLAKVSPIVKQVFIIHHIYIVFVLLAFSALCFLFAERLTSPDPLGRFLSGCMALFWSARVLIQCFYYDKAVRRLNRCWDMVFTLAFVSLAGVFSLAALRLIS